MNSNVVKLVRLSTALLSEYRLFQMPSLSFEDDAKHQI